MSLKNYVNKAFDVVTAIRDMAQRIIDITEELEALRTRVEKLEAAPATTRKRAPKAKTEK